MLVKIRKKSSSKKGSPIVLFRILINDEIYDYLKDVNGRFKENELFLNDYKLETHRCVNQKYFTKAQGFYFKLQKARQLKYNQFTGYRLLININLLTLKVSLRRKSYIRDHY